MSATDKAFWFKVAEKYGLWPVLLVLAMWYAKVEFIKPAFDRHLQFLDQQVDSGKQNTALMARQTSLSEVIAKSQEALVVEQRAMRMEQRETRYAIERLSGEREPRPQHGSSSLPARDDVVTQ